MLLMPLPFLVRGGPDVRAHVEQGGQGDARRGRQQVEELQPPDHTRVCFAAAIGAAMRSRYSENGEAVGRLALAMLADGTAGCICSRRSPARRRGGH